MSKSIVLLLAAVWALVSCQPAADPGSKTYTVSGEYTIAVSLLPNEGDGLAEVALFADDGKKKAWDDHLALLSFPNPSDEGNSFQFRNVPAGSYFVEVRYSSSGDFGVSNDGNSDSVNFTLPGTSNLGTLAVTNSRD